MKGIAIVCFVAALGVVGFWVQSGSSLYTQTSVQEKQTQTDDFGDTQEVIVWKDQFVPGGLDFAAPIAGGLTALGIGLLWYGRRKAKD